MMKNHLSLIIISIISTLPICSFAANNVNIHLYDANTYTVSPYNTSQLDIDFTTKYNTPAIFGVTSSSNQQYTTKSIESRLKQELKEQKNTVGIKSVNQIRFNSPFNNHQTHFHCSFAPKNITNNLSNLAIIVTPAYCMITPMT